MATKLSTIEDETEGRRLAAAIKRKLQVNARFERGQIVTDDPDVGGEQLKRVRKYAEGWKDSLAEAR